MRIHVIACRVFARELCYLAARTENIIDITFLPQGLHDTPVILKNMVSDAIADIPHQLANTQMKHRPDAIALCYGLCSNGVAGVQSGEFTLVVPKTDDCIALFLGSQQRYRDVFAERPGTYWFNNGWIEAGHVPCESHIAERRAEYTEKYGRENADYLIDQISYEWVKNYSTAGYISSPVYDNDEYRALTERTAQQYGWNYNELIGDTRLIEALLAGDWDEREFLVCPPGHTVMPSYGSDILKSVPSDQAQPEENSV